MGFPSGSWHAFTPESRAQLGRAGPGRLLGCRTFPVPYLDARSARDSWGASPPWPGRFGNLAREQQEMTVTDCKGAVCPGGSVSSAPLTHLAWPLWGVSPAAGRWEGGRPHVPDGPRPRPWQGWPRGAAGKGPPAISLPSALRCSSASCAQVAPDCHSPAVETQGVLPGGCRLTSAWLWPDSDAWSPPTLGQLRESRGQGEVGAKVRAAVTGRTHIPPALPLLPARPGDPCDLHRSRRTAPTPGEETRPSQASRSISEGLGFSNSRNMAASFECAILYISCLFIFKFLNKNTFNFNLM